MGKFFYIEKSTPSHIAFSILGIKFRYLKSEIKKDRIKFAKYYQSFESATMIPKASGTLRLVQKANAKFIEQFDKFCEENQLKYWIDFGTLLGAIRHKGFIPWDDDIDIAMPREDYERLISEFITGFPNNHFELIFENNKKNKCFIKLKHKLSENIFIDIFPYDYYHSKLTEAEKLELSSKIVKSRKPKLFKRFKNVKHIRDNFKNITQNHILEEKSFNIEDKPALFMGIDFPHNWKNKVYDWETIFPIRKINFEGIELCCPNNPEKVLESIYGNYMSIPKDSYPRHSNYISLPTAEKKLLEEMVQ